MPDASAIWSALTTTCNAGLPQRCSAWRTGTSVTSTAHAMATSRRSPASNCGDYLADVMGCSLALADIQITQGRLRDAQQTFESALRHSADSPGLRGTADMHVGLSLLAIEHNDLDTAADHLLSSAELGEHMGLPQHPYRWRVAMARLHEAQGDLDNALELLTQAEARYNTDYSPSVRPVSASKARIEVKRGDLDAGRKVGGRTRALRT